MYAAILRPACRTPDARARFVLLGHVFARWIGERGLVAMERLMGMFLVAIAVEMLLSGVSRYVSHSTPLGN